jgi:hypothetical protein
MTEEDCEHDWQPLGSSWVDTGELRAVLHQNEQCSRCDEKRRGDTRLAFDFTINPK